MTRPLRDARQRLLLRLALRGHTPSFRRLYRELSGPILRYLGSRLGNSADAEDVASEVFRKFVTRLDRYDSSRGNVQSWLFSMARSTLIDHLRRQQPMQPLDAIAETLADGCPDGLTQVLADEEARFASGLLLHHPPEVREMFSLHFAHGLSYREIATAMSLSEAAVKQRFARTLRALRQQLQPQPEEQATRHRATANPPRPSGRHDVVATPDAEGAGG
jgi:RNA polymerase sigma-70 factor (ECF subfamily)